VSRYVLPASTASRRRDDRIIDERVELLRRQAANEGIGAVGLRSVRAIAWPGQLSTDVVQWAARDRVARLAELVAGPHPDWFATTWPGQRRAAP
jgi:hypothetical protein